LIYLIIIKITKSSCKAWIVGSLVWIL